MSTVFVNSPILPYSLWCNYQIKNYQIQYFLIIYIYIDKNLMRIFGYLSFVFSGRFKLVLNRNPENKGVKTIFRPFVN